jgi:hypothetical protein
VVVPLAGSHNVELRIGSEVDVVVVVVVVAVVDTVDDTAVDTAVDKVEEVDGEVDFGFGLVNIDCSQVLCCNRNR